MIVYPPIFHCDELKLTFKGKLTRKVVDTLHYVYNFSVMQPCAYHT